MYRWQHYWKKEVKEKYLFRFMSNTNLDLFLKSGAIWFSRADQFGDKMECSRIKDLRGGKPDIEALKRNQKQYIISCWHLADKESLAFWDTFAGSEADRRVYAVRFKTHYLLNVIQRAVFQNEFYYRSSFTHGHVRYRKLAGLTSLEDEKIRYVAFRKEFAFRYEEEYRFVVRSERPFEHKGQNYYLSPTKELKFDILVNPFLEKDRYRYYQEHVLSGPLKAHLKNSDLADWLKPSLW
jgi:hypothetical protein